ncbi:ATP-dependent exoDNAse (exonuclease V), alpha subunit - helicase superfamily I member [Cellulophaga lytica DSM 7489]|uniref:ATP-dependent exoDNAse (Exonuclease V), alpha subunit-helicase superfamily I member n=1 Tax=Cellulophaga lytica (strain ATCC 23178 / DSM 7489 / JCM 8516 / NBRC 14961 / NCIMB 1423 / VKM B-1433 / Cy l20) TaxID=867900 RepID=F0RIP9_CELLC|nr:ATP-binding domain-containing protein [Cellulophaga lytica]ADY30393.1 ATP-dependent exoDNAse (exonuclease V), alpha subunit - helicase superfamily I member [Cellulophaga lytica DSM 7489]WQG78674.1 AAA family ATPase [Cellulophaga lytica]
MNLPTSTSFFKILKEKFPFEPTLKQLITLEKLSQFLVSKNKDDLFLLKGYAGTGKTTIVGTIVTNLWNIKMKAVLLAPTGRAAKVMSNYSNTKALTIHKKIYFPKKQSGGGIQFTLAPNKHTNTVFVVDEASMIPDAPSDSKLFENGSLLDDLMSYVYSGKNCKLVLIGDTAQLPPVKLDISPALDEDRLSLNYNKDVTKVELDEVMRQAEDSGILMNATNLREQLHGSFFEDFKFDVNPYKDIVRLIEGNDILEAIEDSYAQNGKEETAFIVRSNKRANLYNANIRNRILYLENVISTGDYMMVVKNNYFWIKPTTEAGFIANGDILEILEIFAIKELYGFKFAEVNVKMVDYPNMPAFETVLLLDTIDAETPSLPYEESNRLYQEVMLDYADETSKYKKFLKVKNNKYFNALQVKFSYAITCHKSQGGQWDTVFVEQPYLPNGIDKDYLRWLYTAVTRAKKQLYLIGFKNDFFLDWE